MTKKEVYRVGVNCFVLGCSHNERMTCQHPTIQIEINHVCKSYQSRFVVKDV